MCWGWTSNKETSAIQNSMKRKRPRGPRRATKSGKSESRFKRETRSGRAKEIQQLEIPSIRNIYEKANSYVLGHVVSFPGVVTSW